MIIRLGLFVCEVSVVERLPCCIVTQHFLKMFPSQVIGIMFPSQVIGISSFIGGQDVTSSDPCNVLFSVLFLNSVCSFINHCFQPPVQHPVLTEWLDFLSSNPNIWHHKIYPRPDPPVRLHHVCHVLSQSLLYDTQSICIVQFLLDCWYIQINVCVVSALWVKKYFQTLSNQPRLSFLL